MDDIGVAYYQMENNLIERIVKGISTGSSESSFADGARAAIILSSLYNNGKGPYWDSVLRGDAKR